MTAKYLIISLLCSLSISIFAQETKRIEVLNANVVEFGEDLGSDVKRLLGDVQFKHEDAVMYCDSAYLNQKLNSLKAFSNVHIVQDDSLDLYGDYLEYSGQSKLAKVRRNVRLIHGESTLKTDSLNFDRNTNIGYYFNWGYIHDKDNDLESKLGYYYSDDKDYYAVEKVKLVNPKYTIYSDSLRYNTGTDISYFYGATDIESDSNYIYCEYGQYDTKSDLARLSKNAYIINKEKKLSGDTLFYDRNTGFGEAKSNITMLDTSQNVSIFGHYACLFENKDSVFVTQEALLSKYGEKDTFYLHADTLILYTVYDSLWIEDTVADSTSLSRKKKDVLSDAYQNYFLDSLIYDGARRLFLTDWELEALNNSLAKNKDDSARAYTLDTIRNVIAYHHSQVFSKDIQLRSDSIAYSSRDSIARFFYQPIIWSEDKQISADYIEAIIEDEKMREMFLEQSAFIILQDDSIRFNQVSGVNMRAFFNDEGELHKLNVLDKTQSVFFAREENEKNQEAKGDLVGVNKTESPKMCIYFKNREVSKISFLHPNKGVLNPIDYIPLEQTFLKGFSWQDEIRPKCKEDVYLWRPLVAPASSSEIK